MEAQWRGSDMAEPGEQLVAPEVSWQGSCHPARSVQPLTRTGNAGSISHMSE